METENVINTETINELSNINNYFGNKSAIKMLSSLSVEEKEIALSDPVVQEAILKIDDVDTLRDIFRKSPAFFQEIMFNNQKIQDLLISPNKNLSREELVQNYNTIDYSFSDKDIRRLEVFLHTIKSPKIYEQLVENKFFQRIVALCSDKQLKKSFFRNLDEVKLYNNIVSDEEIFNTSPSRKRNILTIFNNVSDHILLPIDYHKIIDDPKSFISRKKWSSKDYEKVYIDEKTLSTFSTEMLVELLKFKNIDKTLIKDYLEKDVLQTINENCDFKKLFPHLLEGNYNSFNDLDDLFFKIIIEKCENNEELKNNFIDFIYKILCKKENLDENEIAAIKNNLYRKMVSNSISKEDFTFLFSNPSPLKTIFYLKIGVMPKWMDMEQLRGISAKQTMYLNIKHINQILKLIDKENKNEIIKYYSYAIKLYLTFGLERTLKILNGDYGKLNEAFFTNVSSLDVSKVNLVKEGNKFIPDISKDFIEFMFATQTNNHFSEMLSDPSSELNKNWYYLYNNFNVIKERCHGVMTLKKVNIILKKLYINLGEIEPNNYKLEENDILNDVILGNKTMLPNEKIYKTLLNIYEQMKRRKESSIPYVSGKSLNGYYYEMMKLNDPIAFALGYKANCCIRLEDVAHNHLLHATLCRNGRILLLYNEKHEFAGFVPLKRNGEVLIANSIECPHQRKDEKAIDAFSDAIKDIVKTSQSNPDEKPPINLVCIGSAAHVRPCGRTFPKKIKTPTIYEKHDPIYRKTDCYHKTLSILYQNPELNLRKIQYGDPVASYRDPRNKASYCDFRNSSLEEQERALKIINAVRYTNFNEEELTKFVPFERYNVSECVFNDDWFVLINYRGEIISDYINYDERAEQEYNIALDEFNKHYNRTPQNDGYKLVKKLK